MVRLSVRFEGFIEDALVNKARWVDLHTPVDLFPLERVLGVVLPPVLVE